MPENKKTPVNVNFHHRHRSRIFWPKWFVRYENGQAFPQRFAGPQRGTHVDQIRIGPASPNDTFMNYTDMLFINNYVFEHCEAPDATISYVPDRGLPKTLTLVRHVAIHASCLFVARDPDDIMWGKQLRFILRNFPKIVTITVVATAIFDIPRPSTCPLPYEFFDIEAVALDDRARLGIMDHQDIGLDLYTTSDGPADSLIAAWNDLERKWPSWKMRREMYEEPKGGLAKKTRRSEGIEAIPPAPEFCLLGVAFFAREWIDMEKVGEHGKLCRLVEQKLNPAVKAALKTENAGLCSQNLGEKVTSLRTRPSTTKLKSRPSIRRMSSAILTRVPEGVEEQQQKPTLKKTNQTVSTESELKSSAKTSRDMPPLEPTPSSSSVKTERLRKPSLHKQSQDVNAAPVRSLISERCHLDENRASNMVPFSSTRTVSRPKQHEQGPKEGDNWL